MVLLMRKRTDIEGGICSASASQGSPKRLKDDQAIFLCRYGQLVLITRDVTEASLERQRSRHNRKAP
jgi:hypothetical protein